MSGMPWQRSPASRCARPIAGNMDAISLRRCPRTCMARTTTSICRTRMCWRRCSGASMKRASRGRPPTLWGSGTPRREFLHADDCADACLFLMDRYSDAMIMNVGAGQDIAIAELAALVAEVVGYRGDMHWDRAKPDGMPRKLMDSSRIAALGWKPATSLADGLRRTYGWYRQQLGESRSGVS
jgi:nucleoside-diphosphate-sugar epimerase